MLFAALGGGELSPSDDTMDLTISDRTLPSMRLRAPTLSFTIL